MVKKKPAEQPHEEHADETWLIPYSDLLTLLLALFIVLFASSSLDKKKAAQIQYAFAAAFGSMGADQMNGTILNFLDDAAKANLGEGIGIGSDAQGATLDITSSILFEKGSDILKADSNELLDKIATLLKGDKYRRFGIAVEGHTDTIETNFSRYKSDWELSSARAGAIVNALIARGLKEERFKSVGMGHIVPKYPNTNTYGEYIPENQERNRRVVVRLEI